ncbi:restriction endonuclease [Methanoculleus taiwanensis]|uniref:restriction endonuclease n=1 Tax=Methanoculleus taiwanensis TaxID=1550565 RepID=UPI000FFE516E|nr:restriction endonuclease [Methanoculleus taiwanensis]
MPKFCPECGTPLQQMNAKFCPECGTGLIPKTSAPTVPTITPTAPPAADDWSEPIDWSEEEYAEEGLQPSVKAYDLGTKLEEIVDSIYQAEGYKTERRVRMPGQGGYTNEIDVVARRGKEQVAIECKNFKAAVGIKEFRDFSKKLDDLGRGWRGVFVAFNDFTLDAQNFAESRNIEILGHEDIMEKWFAVSAGRVSRKGDRLILKSALSVKSDYLMVTTLPLLNKHLIEVSSARLTFHPYVKVPYAFKAKVYDPTKRLHTFSDDGTVVIDLLDGKVLNGQARKGGSLLNSLSSSKQSADNTQTLRTFDEVLNSSPSPEYTITIGSDYQITELKPEITKRAVERAAIEYISARNTEDMAYTTAKADTIFDTKHRTFVPRRGDIKLFKSEMVFVPKWAIHFNAFGTIYTKEVFAHSGTVLENTIEYCPLHFKLGAFNVKKETTAVCEVCGKAYCSEHISQCPTCGKWVCKDHASVCSSCGKTFCEEHASKICRGCHLPLCSDCEVECPICHKPYGANHTLICDTCGAAVCPGCITTSGLLRKTRVCKNCS